MEKMMYVIRLPNEKGSPPKALLALADPKVRGEGRAIKINIKMMPMLSRLPGFTLAGYQCVHPEKFWILTTPHSSSFGILPDGTPTHLTREDQKVRKFVLANVDAINSELNVAFGYLKLVAQA